jgi:hypothetical protein
MADLNYEDYKSAAQRLLSGESKEGSPAYVQDANIFKLGDTKFGKQLEAEMQPPAQAAGDQPDPNSPLNIGARAAAGAAFGVPDTLATATNAIAGLAEKAGIATPRGSQPPLVAAPDATPEARAFVERANASQGRLPIPSQVARQALASATGGRAGLDMPADAGPAQAIGEGALTGVLGGLGTGAYNTALAARRAMPAVGKVISTAVAPAAGSYYGGKLGEGLGGETGADIGSLLGGAAVMGGPMLRRGVEQHYAQYGAPDAAQIADTAAKYGITPTAGMLGNTAGQQLEHQLSGVRGGRDVIDAARQKASAGIASAADTAAVARGATTDRPEPGTIGADVITAAGAARQNLGDRVSALQSDLENRVGPGTQVDVSSVLSAMNNVVRDPVTNQLRAPSTTAQPVTSRIQSLQDLQDPNTGTVRYEALKNFRSDLGRTTQSTEGVPSHMADQIYGPITKAMQDAAAARGVPPQEFAAAQNETRQIAGSGGPLNYFTRIAGQPGTSGETIGGMRPQQAYSSVVKAGEQSPQLLQPFEKYAPPGAFDQIMGDALRNRIQQTLEAKRATNLSGFQNWWDNLTPEAQRMYGGNQQAALQDFSNLAGRLNYPTQQTGLTKSMGGQMGEIGARLSIADLLSKALQASGIPGAGSVGRIAGYFGAYPALGYARARGLESEAARRGMTGNFSRPLPSAGDLNAILAAAQAARPQQ